MQEHAQQHGAAEAGRRRSSSSGAVREARLSLELGQIAAAEAGAGGRTRRQWAAAAPQVRHLLPEFELHEQYTTGPGSATDLAASAVAAGAEVVLAVGGDGTLHEVVTGFMQQAELQQQWQQHPGAHTPPATALAVLPLGTGSDFSRTMQWRGNDVAGACSRIRSGRVQLVDVARLVLQQCRCTAGATEPVAHEDQQQQQQQRCRACGCPVAVHYAVNMCSCGASAEAVELAAGGLKRWLTAWLAYPVASALALLKQKRGSIQIRSDGEGEWTRLDDLTMLVVGNGRYAGGGMCMLPAADPCDGALDAMSFQGLGLMQFIASGRLLFAGKQEQVPGVRVLPRCCSIEVMPAPGTSCLAWEVDGEFCGRPPGCLASVRVVPAAVGMLC